MAAPWPRRLRRSTRSWSVACSGAPCWASMGARFSSSSCRPRCSDRSSTGCSLPSWPRCNRSRHGWRRRLGAERPSSRWSSCRQAWSSHSSRRRSFASSWGRTGTRWWRPCRFCAPPCISGPVSRPARPSCAPAAPSISGPGTTSSTRFSSRSARPSGIAGNLPAWQRASSLPWPCSSP